MNKQANIEVETDIVDDALSEMVRTGRVLLTKDDEGRDVFTLVDPS